MDQLLFNVVRNIIAFFVLITLFKNCFFLALAPFYPIQEKLRYIRYARKSSGKKQPRISIIVPAWNEEIGVIKTIDSVIKNGYSNTELIVINDGSTDNTDLVIRDYFKEIKEKPASKQFKIWYISQKNAGKGAALNAGIKQATGEIILTVDADSVLRKGALAKLVKYYLDPEVMAVVGNVEVANTKTLIGFAQQLEYYFGFYNKRAHAILGGEYIFGGACASFRSDIFKTLGLFDVKNKTEDIEMSMRIRYAGYKCTYAEDVVCYTEGASDLKSLIAQRVRWKKGRLDTFRKYRGLFFSTEDHHNFFLSFFVLPMSLLAEIQLIFEPIAIAILITYSLVTSEYLSIAIGILFILLVYVAVSLFHNSRPRPGLLLLFPFTWPLFYLLDWIEFLALYKSTKMIIQGKDVKWQNWQRQGIKPAADRGKV
jgi:poly-beta-1,6-N-acetyl-D-glucosamine synthase